MRWQWICVAIIVLSTAGCSGTSHDAANHTTTTSQPYDGASYATQVRNAILDSFNVRSFADACPQPDWVCAMGRIESPGPGQLEVTLQPDWEAAFGEWTGPPAGVGCPKWGEQLRRNITNFVTAAHVPAPRYISVREPNGRNC